MIRFLTIWWGIMRQQRCSPWRAWTLARSLQDPHAEQTPALIAARLRDKPHSIQDGAVRLTVDGVACGGRPPLTLQYQFGQDLPDSLVQAYQAEVGPALQGYLNALAAGEELLVREARHQLDHVMSRHDGRVADHFKWSGVRRATA